MKKFFIIMLTLFLSAIIISCSLDEEADQNSGVVYYTAKTDAIIETYANSNKFVQTFNDEPANTESVVETNVLEIDDAATVYVTPSGKKYHFSKTCPGRNSTPTTLEEAILSGRDACKKCTD